MASSQTAKEQAEEVDMESASHSVEIPSKRLKKPRKKSQAFGVPKTAAVKKLIDRNAAESPLLRLPREVRSRIWNYAIGGRLLHIETVTSNQLRATCCLIARTEQQIFERSNVPLKGLDDLIANDDAAYGQYMDATSLQRLPVNVTERREIRRMSLRKHPHHFCQKAVAQLRSGKGNLLQGNPLDSKQHILAVHILRVCRQTYIEAHPLLWRSNILSFHDPDDLSRFMAERLTAQKAAITSLHLDFSWMTLASSTSSRFGTVPSGIITSLSGLRKLHLYVEEGFGVDAEISDFYKIFRRLSLSNVTVVFVDRLPRVWEERRHEEHVLKAKALIETILDPDGPAKHEKEQADLKATRKAEQERVRLLRPACDQASTKEECARMRQADMEGQQFLKDKPTKRRTVGACDSEHVCLVCLKELTRTREEARECPKPGNCDEGYFKIMFKNTYTTNKDLQISVHLEDAVSDGR